jgi:hypothetical protein
LVGELDLKDFTYEDGVKIYLAPHLDKRQLSIINQPAKSQVIQLQEAQEWLDKNYPKNTRSKEKYLYIPHKNLTGFLNLNDFTNLEKLDCSNNKFTGQHLSVIT